MALKHLTPDEMANAPKVFPPLGAAAYEYQGRLYAGNGRQCNNAGDIIPDPDLDTDLADVAVQDGGTPVSSGEQSPGGATSETPINLVAWARDEKKYPWINVQAAIKEQHNQSFIKASEAKAFLLGLATQ
jgi:hypothetical protein